MSTKERLAKALEGAGAPAVMVALARQGRYDDYESKFPTPIIDLVRDAMHANLGTIAKRAQNGEFDGTRDEGEAWMKREGQFLIQ